MHLVYNFLIDIVIMFSSISGLFICWLIYFDQIYKMMNTYLKKMSTQWWWWKLVQPYENCKKILGRKTGCLLTFWLHNCHIYTIYSFHDVAVDSMWSSYDFLVIFYFICHFFQACTVLYGYFLIFLISTIGQCFQSLPSHKAMQTCHFSLVVLGSNFGVKINGIVS